MSHFQQFCYLQSLTVPHKIGIHTFALKLLMHMRKLGHCECIKLCISKIWACTYAHTNILDVC